MLVRLRHLAHREQRPRDDPVGDDNGWIVMPLAPVEKLPGIPQRRLVFPGDQVRYRESEEDGGSARGLAELRADGAGARVDGADLRGRVPARRDERVAQRGE